MGGAEISHASIYQDHHSLRPNACLNSELLYNHLLQTLRGVYINMPPQTIKISCLKKKDNILERDFFII